MKVRRTSECVVPYRTLYWPTGKQSVDTFALARRVQRPTTTAPTDLHNELCGRAQAVRIAPNG